MLSSLGCSLGPLVRQLEPLVLAQEPPPTRLATRTPWPTFSPTSTPSATPSAQPPTGTPTFTPMPTPTPTATASPTPLPSSTPTPTATAAAAPLPTATRVPPRPATPTPTATFTPPATPTPSFAYNMVEVYEDYTSNLFLTGYIAIVNAQEIPIGGIKAVGSFEPGGQQQSSPLSQWFFDARTAPGVVMKTASVKFEPPGNIQAGTWFIHLEDEHGTQLSENVAINTDPASPKWFYVKFKQPGPPGAQIALATATRVIAGGSATASAGATATPAASGGWSFVNLGTSTYSGRGNLLVYGEAVNDSGASQQINHLMGTFYDAQGQVMADTGTASDYWPIYIVPSGAKVPFKLSVNGAPGVADFDLQIASQASSQAPRQDLQFADLRPARRGANYCVKGKLSNPGDALQDYLVIAAVLYNAQGNVVGFDSYEEYSVEDIVGDETLNFEVCADPLGQEVAHYEMRAWGK
jgi:hypothetical protein